LLSQNGQKTPYPPLWSKYYSTSLNNTNNEGGDAVLPNEPVSDLKSAILLLSVLRNPKESESTSLWNSLLAPHSVPLVINKKNIDFVQEFDQNDTKSNSKKLPFLKKDGSTGGLSEPILPFGDQRGNNQGAHKGPIFYKDPRTNKRKMLDSCSRLDESHPNNNPPSGEYYDDEVNGMDAEEASQYRIKFDPDGHISLPTLPSRPLYSLNSLQDDQNDDFLSTPTASQHPSLSSPTSIATATKITLKTQYSQPQPLITTTTSLNISSDATLPSLTSANSTNNAEIIIPAHLQQHKSTNLIGSGGLFGSNPLHAMTSSGNGGLHSSTKLGLSELSLLLNNSANNLALSKGLNLSAPEHKLALSNMANMTSHQSNHFGDGDKPLDPLLMAMQVTQNSNEEHNTTEITMCYGGESDMVRNDTIGPHVEDGNKNSTNQHKKKGPSVSQRHVIKFVLQNAAPNHIFDRDDGFEQNEKHKQTVPQLLFQTGFNNLTQTQKNLTTFVLFPQTRIPPSMALTTLYPYLKFQIKPTILPLFPLYFIPALTHQFTLDWYDLQYPQHFLDKSSIPNQMMFNKAFIFNLEEIENNTTPVIPSIMQSSSYKNNAYMHNRRVHEAMHIALSNTSNNKVDYSFISQVVNNSHHNDNNMSGNKQQPTQQTYDVLKNLPGELFLPSRPNTHCEKCQEEYKNYILRYQNLVEFASTQKSTHFSQNRLNTLRNLFKVKTPCLCAPPALSNKQYRVPLSIYSSNPAYYDSLTSSIPIENQQQSVENSNNNNQNHFQNNNNLHGSFSLFTSNSANLFNSASDLLSSTPNAQINQQQQQQRSRVGDPSFRSYPGVVPFPTLFSLATLYQRNQHVNNNSDDNEQQNNEMGDHSMDHPSNPTPTKTSYSQSSEQLHQHADNLLTTFKWLLSCLHAPIIYTSTLIEFDEETQASFFAKKQPGDLYLYPDDYIPLSRVDIPAPVFDLHYQQQQILLPKDGLSSAQITAAHPRQTFSNPQTKQSITLDPLWIRPFRLVDQLCNDFNQLHAQKHNISTLPSMSALTSCIDFISIANQNTVLRPNGTLTDLFTDTHTVSKQPKSLQKQTKSYQMNSLHALSPYMKRLGSNRDGEGDQENDQNGNLLTNSSGSKKNIDDTTTDLVLPDNNYMASNGSDDNRDGTKPESINLDPNCTNLDPNLLKFPYELNPGNIALFRSFLYHFEQLPFEHRLRLWRYANLTIPLLTQDEFSPDIPLLVNVPLMGDNIGFVKSTFASQQVRRKQYELNLNIQSLFLQDENIRDQILGSTNAQELWTKLVTQQQHGGNSIGTSLVKKNRTQEPVDLGSQQLSSGSGNGGNLDSNHMGEFIQESTVVVSNGSNPTHSNAQATGSISIDNNNNNQLLSSQTYVQLGAPGSLPMSSFLGNHQDSILLNSIGHSIGISNDSSHFLHSLDPSEQNLYQQRETAAKILNKPGRGRKSLQHHLLAGTRPKWAQKKLAMLSVFTGSVNGSDEINHSSTSGGSIVPDEGSTGNIPKTKGRKKGKRGNENVAASLVLDDANDDELDRLVIGGSTLNIHGHLLNTSFNQPSSYRAMTTSTIEYSHDAYNNNNNNNHNSNFSLPNNTISIPLNSNNPALNDKYYYQNPTVNNTTMLASHYDALDELAAEHYFAENVPNSLNSLPHHLFPAHQIQPTNNNPEISDNLDDAFHTAKNLFGSDCNILTPPQTLQHLNGNEANGDDNNNNNNTGNNDNTTTNKTKRSTPKQGGSNLSLQLQRHQLQQQYSLAPLVPMEQQQSQIQVNQNENYFDKTGGSRPQTNQNNPFLAQNNQNKTTNILKSSLSTSLSPAIPGAIVVNTAVTMSDSTTTVLVPLTNAFQASLGQPIGQEVPLVFTSTTTQDFFRETLVNSLNDTNNNNNNNIGTNFEQNLNRPIVRANFGNNYDDNFPPGKFFSNPLSDDNDAETFSLGQPKAPNPNMFFSSSSAVNHGGNSRVDHRGTPSLKANGGVNQLTNHNMTPLLNSNQQLAHLAFLQSNSITSSLNSHYNQQNQIQPPQRSIFEPGMDEYITTTAEFFDSNSEFNTGKKYGPPTLPPPMIAIESNTQRGLLDQSFDFKNNYFDSGDQQQFGKGANGNGSSTSAQNQHNQHNQQNVPIFFSGGGQMGLSNDDFLQNSMGKPLFFNDTMFTLSGHQSQNESRDETK
jgi:hypothetical protein